MRRFVAAMAKLAAVILIRIIAAIHAWPIAALAVQAILVQTMFVWPAVGLVLLPI